MPNDVLIPMDESGPAENALEYALSAFPEASLTALHALDITAYSKYGGEMGLALLSEDLIDRQQRERASTVLAESVATADTEGRTLQTETREGDPATVIVNYAADEGMDHIVIGSHGRTGVKRLLLGSVAEAVVRRSSVPVTVVPEF